MIENVKKFVSKTFNDQETEREILSKVHLLTDYHCGGYAKVTPDLIEFMRNFTSESGVELDPVYTAKTALGMEALAEEKGDFSEEKWLFIHSGGMQGLQSIERKIGEKIY